MHTNESHDLMQMSQSGPDPEQPVAYDQYGNPLYAHPAQPTQFVHTTRSLQPIEPEIPEIVQQLHAESMKKYPHLNLSREEYIVSAIKRHPIGLLKIWGIAAALIAAFMALMVGLFFNGGSSVLASTNGSFVAIGSGVLIFLIIIVVIGALVATYVYNANHFYLTNESVIQEIQTGLFVKHEQTVSLSNVEDASYKQGGIFQTIFNYGTIRLSTEGDETTYRFTYAAQPKKQIAILNNAVEAFKNGRPVPSPYEDQPS